MVAKIKRGAGVMAGLAEAVSRVFSTPQLQSHLWRNTPTPQPGEQSPFHSISRASRHCPPLPLSTVYSPRSIFLFKR